MNRKHAGVIALVLGLAAALGAFAAIHTARLGAAARSGQTAQLAQRERRLVAAEAALRRAVTSAAAPSAARRSRFVYVRQAPIVVHRHLGHDDGEGEAIGDD